MTDPGPLAGYDLGGLDRLQVEILLQALTEAGIAHDLVGGELQAPSADAELVEALIARAGRTTGDPEHDRTVFADVVVADDGPLLAGPVLAGRGHRFLAYLVESILFAVPIIALSRVTPVGGRIAVIGFGLANGLVLVALVGGTVGMLLFRLRVVAARSVAAIDGDLRPPGWRVATVRYLVVVWPGLVFDVVDVVSGPAPEWLARVASFWSLVCFGPILFDPLRRGLHDRAAGTLVVDTRRSAPAP